MSDKLEFKVGDKEYYVTKPSARQEKDGMIVFAKTLTKALKEGIMSHDKLDKVIRDEGVWDDDKQKKVLEIAEFLTVGIHKLSAGGIKLSDARTLAIQMRTKRFEYIQLVLEKTRLEGCTAEAIADRERTDFFVSVCVKNSDGSKVFSSLEDYQEKQDSELGNVVSSKFAKLYNGYEEDLGFSKYPENEFLLKYKFTNEKLELVDKDGKFVDVEGNTMEEPQKVEFKEFLEG